MNWLSFFIGLLIGWLIEWLIDFFYWRRKWQAAVSPNTEELESLHAENLALNAKVASLYPAPLPSLNLELDGLRAENAELRAQVEALPSLNLDLGDLRAENAELRAQVASLQAPNLGLAAAGGAVSGALGVQAAPLYPAPLSSLNLELDGLRAENAELRAQVEALPSLNLDLGDLRAENAELRAQVEALPSLNLDLGDLRAENAELRAQVEALPSLNLDLDGLRAENAELRAQVASLQAPNLGLAAAGGAVSGALGVQAGSLSSLNLELDGLRAENAELRAQVEALLSLNLDLDGLRAENAELRAQIASLQAPNLGFAAAGGAVSGALGVQAGSQHPAPLYPAPLPSLNLELDGLRAENAELRAQVEALPSLNLGLGDLRAENAELRAQVASLQAPNLGLAAAGGAVSGALGARAASLAFQGPDLEALRAENATLSVELEQYRQRVPVLEARLAAFGGRPNDLTRIEGIGPKIAEILKQHGITSFAQLAEIGTGTLREMLSAAGDRFRLSDPTTWAEQAQLAAQGDWDALSELQNRLRGGRR